MRWKSNADVRARPFGAPLRVLVLHSAQVHAREEKSLSMSFTACLQKSHSTVVSDYFQQSASAVHILPFGAPRAAEDVMAMVMRHGAGGSSSCEPWRRIAAKARGTKRRGKSASTSWSSGVVPNHMAT